ncbi:acetyltransferase [Corynebacterium glutamicum]|uniref:acetyltransferase n=1 Tax=Corynebacterium glutamicum TaxID=1718 RepID=UPI003B631A7A
MDERVLDTKKIVVVGASGFGRESLDVLIAMQEAGSNIEIVGVIDDNPSDSNLERLEDRQINFLGSVDDLLESNQKDFHFVLGIGSPEIRAKIVETIENAGLTAFTAVHPTASLGTNVTLSSGVVICAGAVISTNVKLGKQVHVNPSVTIGHDTVIGDFTSINPGAVISGEVKVGKGVLVGASSTILQQLSVDDGSVIGAMALATKDVPGTVVVKGIPGKWSEKK